MAMAQTRGIRTSVTLDHCPLRASLDSLMRVYSVSIVYMDDDVADRSVSVSCGDCSLQEALNAVIAGTPLTWIMTGNQVILRKRPDLQTASLSVISGFVTDSSNASALAGGVVRLMKQGPRGGAALSGWCPTNASGFYSLSRVKPGSYVLVIHVLGYHTAEIPIGISDGAPVRRDIPLSQEEIRMQEVTIEGRRSELMSSAGLTRGMYIPSSPEDQNEYFLNGARIYNPAHFGGALNTFNPDALNDVEEFNGGPPPYYGGGIGGILDISMRDGSRDRFSGSAGAGSLGAHLTLEGPLGNAVSVVASGRRGFPDAAVPFLRQYGTANRQGSSELMVKLTAILSGSSRAYLSGYVGRDLYTNQVEGDGQRLNNIFSWGNSALDLQWLGIVSSSTFVQASAAFTRYDLGLDQGLSHPGVSMPSTDLFLSGFAIDDLTFRAYAEHYYDMEHTFRAGVELTRHALSGNITMFSTQFAPITFDDAPSWELAVHAEDQWRFLPGVVAEIGARATTFTSTQGSVSAVDPRFSFRYSPIEETQIYASLCAVNQFLHPYRNSGVFLLYPTTFWYPSSDKVKPSTSLQLRVGAETALGGSSIIASAGGFYRLVENLHEFAFDSIASGSTNLEDALLYGTGKSYGIELSVRKRVGELHGSINYILSWGDNRVPGLNGGKPYPPQFDRRHEVQISGSYSPDEDWDVSLLAVLAIESISEFPSFIPSVKSYTGPVPPVRASNTPVWLFDVNGDKYPGFQRLELQVVRSFRLVQLPCTVSLRLMNAYGLLDPFEWQLQNSADVRFRWKASLQDLKLFPLFPSLGLTVRF